ncbi:O-methyltransferase [Actinopolyspora xinjiangensis]|uniref:O-methyltransferase n=1 Tax=Actinopolyspora xinjiangensis TaxID=405564 RepID=A0A1H0X2Y2_9ACTN|nr:methyltransferase [Actinopolyspora xinjiangensis]SDP97304.1 O-methyltransferase [Actinopolyspora xinjiangensis]
MRGRGKHLREILRRRGDVRGVLFDTESVVVDAVEELRSGELSDRCEIVSGDAREAVPEEGDAYLLSAVLHNWNDETCVRILSRYARAAWPGARILIFEVLLDEAGEWSMMEAVSDLGMFVLFGAPGNVPRGTSPGCSRNQGSTTRVESRSRLRSTSWKRGCPPAHEPRPVRARSVSGVVPSHGGIPPLPDTELCWDPLAGG